MRELEGRSGKAILMPNDYKALKVYLLANLSK